MWVERHDVKGQKKKKKKVCFLGPTKKMVSFSGLPGSIFERLHQNSFAPIEAFPTLYLN